MATQNRKIEGAVVHRGRTYTAGQEDVLARVLPTKDIARLVEKGVLSGNWTGAPTSSAKSPESPEVPDATAPAESGGEAAAPSTASEPATPVAEAAPKAAKKTAKKAGGKRAATKSDRGK